MADETFGAFDIVKATQYLNIREIQPWTIDWQPISPSNFLKVGFEGLQRQITPGSNEWEQRLYMELVFVETLREHRGLKMWQERHIDYGENPFRGKVDFAITLYQIAFKTPFVVLIEAKKENFDLGWGQCLMAMKTCQLLNQRENIQFDIFGIVSTGTIWEFGRLTVEDQFFKTESYTLSQPEAVLGILEHIFAECERNLALA